jgi:UDP:flavonoid glycosyltransferase YjiC (YdhE family)
LRDYRTLVLALRQQGAHIVYIVPPMYEACYEPNRADFDAYVSKMKDAMPPGPVIDFSGPAYAGLRRSRESFVDCLHLNAAGAARMDVLLNTLVPAALTSY